MERSPYIIELHGGFYDGFRQPCDFVPFSTSLELPGPELKLPGAFAARTEVYEHSRSTVAFLAESPVVAFHFRYVGSRIDWPRPTSPKHWLQSLRGSLRRIWQRSNRSAKPSVHGIPMPGSNKESMLHTLN